MTVARIAVSLRRKLRAKGLLAVVREWEVEHGAITDEERRAATRELGWRYRHQP